MDATEAARVLAYWRAGRYHPDPLGLDGYAPGGTSGLAGMLGPAQSGQSAPVLSQQGPAAYTPGGTVRLTNRFASTDALLSLVWRPQLPDGWRLLSVSGDGGPEAVRGAILWTATTLANDLSVVCTVEVPTNATRAKEIGGEVEYQFAGMANPASAAANTLRLIQGGVVEFTHVEHPAEGPVRLSMFAEPGQSFVIEATSDFLHWTPVSTNASVNGTVVVTDSTAAGHPWRFYRAAPQ
jgi:hypothetical protein